MIPLTVTLALSPAQWRAFQNLAECFGCSPDQVCAHVLLYGFHMYLKRHGIEGPPA